MYYYSEYECPACGREFNTQHAMHQHMNAKDHWPVECAICDETFPDKQDCQGHEHVEHNHCSDCCRTFQNYNNLRMHLNSSRHRGASVACPYCQRGFTTAAGLAHHLETNSCPHTTSDRDAVYRFVRGKDPHGVIAKPLLEWDGPCRYEATERTWNGDGYECYLCNREFNSLHGLNQHLNSAAHQQALYHCPNRNCRDFKTLAAILNHLESESCGITRFQTVQSSVDRMMRKGNLLTF